ncbi:hypothetical protein [Actinokineospora sp. UTMC 2448]|uniref:hypothetical protein n=1 Tax=Actinokineospora sp. UTMC 2448 TaxID=2268449 RepID=UPI002164C543|nr:hypothetical protein [Actinokineospora sp. UTMC 2448]UVS81847.1 hypothetical protein Actkin_05611 [Actinokineospora sp. UTMC 2448]
MAQPVRLPAHLVRQHSYLAPPDTHFRQASCEEVDCPAWREGFVVDLDETRDPGMGQAQYLRANRRQRAFAEEVLADGRTRFRFPPGQRCLRSSRHRVRIEDRLGLFVVRNGGGEPRLLKPEQWRDDLGEALDDHAIRISRR